MTHELVVGYAFGRVPPYAIDIGKSPTRRFLGEWPQLAQGVLEDGGYGTVVLNLAGGFLAANDDGGDLGPHEVGVEIFRREGGRLLREGRRRPLVPSGDLVPDGCLEIEPLGELSDDLAKPVRLDKPGIERANDDAALCALSTYGDRTAGGGEAANLRREIERAIGVVPQVGDVDEAAATRVENAGGLVGDQISLSSRLRRYRAFVVLVGAELVDVENILNLVARQGGG